MIMSWLKYFFANITHHQPAAVNLVHLIIITALVCFFILSASVLSLQNFRIF